VVTQPEQRLRWAVERELRSGNIETAIATMSAHQRGDFPPHWDPPPRVGYGEKHPPLLEVMETVLASNPKPWVRQLFVEKYEYFLGWGYSGVEFWGNLEHDEIDRHLSILERIPEGRRILNGQRDFLYVIEDRWSESDLHRIQRLLGEENQESTAGRPAPEPPAAAISPSGSEMKMDLGPSQGFE
jgi:hypothetical protein